jgi:hypothetical protein
MNSAGTAVLLLLLGKKRKSFTETDSTSSLRSH